MFHLIRSYLLYYLISLGKYRDVYLWHTKIPKFRRASLIILQHNIYNYYIIFTYDNI